jgi:uncharacterized protein
MPRLTRHERLITINGADVAFADMKTSNLAVIVTHPWGPLGGSLSNNVVASAVRYFQSLGITTLRFNFTGSQIGQGTTQVDQLREIASRLLEGSLSSFADSLVPTKLLLCGYSYGSIISATASAFIPQVIAIISIAPPYGVARWLLCFNQQYHFDQAASRKDIHRLFVMGDQDNFTAEAQLRSIIQEYFQGDKRTTLIVMPDVDHFFGGAKAHECLELVGDWFRNNILLDDSAIHTLR